jgi:hypothetical protein
MADETTPQAGTEPTTPAAVDTQANTEPTQAVEDVKGLPDWAQKLITELRSENGKHRKAKTEAEKQAAKAAEDAAKEQGKWKELYDSTKPKAERAEALEAFIADMLKAELAGVPDKLKGLVPAFDDPLKQLEWVRNAKDAGVLAGPTAPQTDAARGTGDTRTAQAANDKNKELDLARRLGLNNAAKLVEQGRI